MDSEEKIGGIPWRNWIPDFSIPKICDIEDCGGPVTRTVYWSELNGDLRHRVYSFVCEDHAPSLYLIIKRIADANS